MALPPIHPQRRHAKASPEASYDLASGRGLSENRRPNGLPLAAVDAEGEVLDVLVQSKRNKHAALKLMRRLLKKYAFAPERLVTDDLRSYSARSGIWGSNAGMSAGNGRTIELRIRISQRGGGSARCSGSRAGLSPEISFHRRRRLQYLQRPTPSHLSPNAPRASRCCDDHVADRSRSGLTIPDRGADTSRSRHGNVAVPSRVPILKHLASG